MTQEDEQLLLQDLCARLPYGICANLPNHHLVSHKYYIHECNVKNGWTTGILNCAGREECYSAEIEDIQPYLRPMSNMTKEELHECQEILGTGVEIQDGFIHIIDSSIKRFTYLEIDAVLAFLNRKMFDFRGLIPKSLALSTEEFNPYKD